MRVEGTRESRSNQREKRVPEREKRENQSRTKVEPERVERTR